MGLGNPPYDDPYLLRFLRARKFDLKKTEKMFVDFIEWRKEKGVDNIQVTMNFFLICKNSKITQGILLFRNR
jgi:hypothetical protein